MPFFQLRKALSTFLGHLKHGDTFAGIDCDVYIRPSALFECLQRKATQGMVPLVGATLD
tara:strand:- start:670 stop:846 length:177 start_codon:yes stop_codon:yes gene_type:complete